MTELLAYENPEARVEMAKGLTTREAVESQDALDIAIENETDERPKEKLVAAYRRLLKYKK